MNASNLLPTALKMDKNQWGRLLDEVFDLRPGFDVQGFGTSWVPPFDVEETQEEYRFYGEMPGMKQENIKLSLADNILTIAGEKKVQYDTEKSNFHRLERSYGSFQRSFSLPHLIRSDKIKATVKDGILEVVVPKSDESKPKQIAITAG